MTKPTSQILTWWSRKKLPVLDRLNRKANQSVLRFRLRKPLGCQLKGNKAETETVIPAYGGIMMTLALLSGKVKANGVIMINSPLPGGKRVNRVQHRQGLQLLGC